MTKEELTSFLLSKGWEMSHFGNLSMLSMQVGRHGLPIMVKYTIRFNKVSATIYKEDVEAPLTLGWFQRNKQIGRSKLIGIVLREDNSVSIGGVVIK